MTRRLVASALIAGCVAGVLAAALHFAFVQRFILLGESYETGAAVHFAGTVAEASDTGAAVETHDHDHEAATPAHDHATGEAGAPILRDLLTTGFMALLYSAYAMILVAGFALAERFGQVISPRDGLLWGIAGFVAVQLAPAMGLSPELPGTAGAALTDRQLWWAATVVCSAAGLAMLGYGRSLLWVALAAVLLAVPHVIGAPEPEVFSGTAPPEVAAAFAARSLGAGLAVWALLGWLAATVWRRQPG